MVDPWTWTTDLALYQAELYWHFAHTTVDHVRTNHEIFPSRAHTACGWGLRFRPRPCLWSLFCLKLRSQLWPVRKLGVSPRSRPTYAGKKGPPWPFRASGCTFLQSAGVWIVLIAMERAYCRVEEYPPCALSPSSWRWSWQTADAERPDCAFVGSPGKLANSWQMGFWARDRQTEKVRMAA